MNERATIAGLAYRGRTASIGFAHGPFVRVDGSDRAAGVSLPRLLMRRRRCARHSFRPASRSPNWPRPSAAMPRKSSNFRWRCWRTTTSSIRSLRQSPRQRLRTRPGRPPLRHKLPITTRPPTSTSRRAPRTWRTCVIASSAPCAAGRAKRPKFRAARWSCADDLPPSQFLEIDWSRGGGLALLRGSPTSHVAMLARARGIPMVVQLGSVPANARTALLDGEGATLELDPSAEQIGLFERRRDLHRKNRASARAILRRPTASWAGEKIRLLDQHSARRGS